MLIQCHRHTIDSFALQDRIRIIGKIIGGSYFVYDSIYFLCYTSILPLLILLLLLPLLFSSFFLFFSSLSFHPNSFQSEKNNKKKPNEALLLCQMQI